MTFLAEMGSTFTPCKNILNPSNKDSYWTPCVDFAYSYSTGSVPSYIYMLPCP